jgi:hypothetical protein
MMHDLSKWILRIMIVLGAIGFGTIYVNRNGWTIAEVPTIFDGSPTQGRSVPPAAFAPAPMAAAAQTFTPCQPIGRTAKGELVYSMDCQFMPQPLTAGTPVPEAPDDGKK